MSQSSEDDFASFRHATPAAAVAAGKSRRVMVICARAFYSACTDRSSIDCIRHFQLLTLAYYVPHFLPSFLPSILHSFPLLPPL